MGAGIGSRGVIIERAVPLPNPNVSTTVKRIDLYKRDCFVLESRLLAESETLDRNPARPNPARGAGAVAVAWRH